MDGSGHLTTLDKLQWDGTVVPVVVVVDVEDVAVDVAAVGDKSMTIVKWV